MIKRSNGNARIATRMATLCAVAGLTVMLSACSDSDDNVDPANDGGDVSGESIAITFEPRLAGQQPACGDTYTASVGNPATDYKMNEYRWYASDFHLRHADGSTAAIMLSDRGDGLQYQDEAHNVALLGFVEGCDTGAEEPATNFVVDGTVAAAEDYTEMCFTLGVPFALNHLDVTDAATPSPLNLPSMNWNWSGGRKFIRFDGVADPAGAAQPFNLHLGSTGCDTADATAAPTSECSMPNTYQYCVALTAGSEYTPSIGLDPARVLEETDIRVNTAGTAAGCMAFPNDPECARIMPKLGLDYMLNEELLPAETSVLFQ